MSKPMREIPDNSKNDLNNRKPKTSDIHRRNVFENQGNSGFKNHEELFKYGTEQAQLEDKLRKLELEADRLKKEGDGLKKEGEEINQRFREQVDDIKRWRDGMTNYQPDQSSSGDTNPFRSMTRDTNPFHSMIGNEQFSGDFTPKPEEKFSSFEGFDATFSELRSTDSTHKSKNFEDKRLENELKMLMYRKFGDEIVKSGLQDNLGTSETNTEVTKIDKGSPSVYRDGNTYFVTYDERNAKGYFGANKDLSKIRCQVNDGLLRELEAKEAYVKWDLPIVYRIHLEKAEGEAQILVTDDEAAVGKRMKDGWAVREVIEREKGFSLVDVHKNELPSYNEIMSDGKKEKIQDKFSDWSHTKDYEAPPPPYPGHEGITSNKDVKEKAKIESENFGEFEAPPAYEDPPAYKKQFTYEVKKAVIKVWSFLSGDKRQRIGLDNHQSEQWQYNLQGYPQDKKQGLFASDYDKKSDILYAEDYEAPSHYRVDKGITSDEAIQKKAEVESQSSDMFDIVHEKREVPPPYYSDKGITSDEAIQKKAEVESQSSDMFDIVHEKREAPPPYYSDKGITSDEAIQKKAEVESQSSDMFDIVHEKREAPPDYDERWLQEFSVSNYSPREQEWSGLSSDKKTKKTKNPIFRPLSWRRRVNNLTSGLTILA